MIFKQNTTFTISILTHNRVDVLMELLESLQNIQRPDCEFILVDNNSVDGTPEMVRERYPWVKLIVLPRNIGVEGRNVGIINAQGEIVITIDDDVIGIDDTSLVVLEEKFSHNERLGGVCFQVRDYYTGKICNWCHPYPEEEYAQQEFLTTEISEGAVAFRRPIFAETGLYPHTFFISHEGADLCARILDRSYDLIYTSKIVVRHKYACEGRKSWRRYYYDTRNDFWLVLRNYRFWYGLDHLVRRSFIMLVYSIRDGFFRYWLKALFDVFCGLPEILAQRKPITSHTEAKIIEINAHKPGVWYYLKKRLGQRQVRI